VHLPDKIVERLRPIFARENLIAHALNLIRFNRARKQKTVIPPQASRSGDLQIAVFEESAVCKPPLLGLQRRSFCIRRWTLDVARWTFSPSP
jgi:hypothetical protein